MRLSSRPLLINPTNDGSRTTMASPTSEISPPPSKRRRISSPAPSQSVPVVYSPSPPPIVQEERCSTRKSPDSKPLRLYSWNINGIQSFLPPSTPQITIFFTTSSKPKSPPPQPSLRNDLQRWKWPHIVFLQEVKIAPSDTKTPRLVVRTVNAPLDTEELAIPKTQLYDAHFCLPKDKYNATGFGGKVYGVCTLIRQDLSPDATVKTVEWDLEGRVQIIEISSLGTTLINVYAVNGTTNDYRDPETGKVTGNRHDRKRAFHMLLANEVKAYEEKGWDIVVAGDINISRSEIDSYPQLRMGEDHVKNRADFEEKFIRELGMLDTFREKRGEERKFSYRPTNKPWGAGGDRVDMMLVTKGLKECVTDADILDTELERGPSDHVPLLVELQLPGNTVSNG